jgi:hypothetical protein
MTNNTIQDKLNFIALAGTRDVIYENRMVNNKRRRLSTLIIAKDIGANIGLVAKNSIQLSLF